MTEQEIKLRKKAMRREKNKKRRETSGQRDHGDSTDVEPGPPMILATPASWLIKEE